MIFVFGSNLAGHHGKGAARFAHRNKGAVWNLGQGRAGESYAIPTKDHDINTLPVEAIKMYVDGFINYAKRYPNLYFQITRVGCGLAGKDDSVMAPMFKDAPDNCFFDTKWKPWLPEKKFWGTF